MPESIQTMTVWGNWQVTLCLLPRRPLTEDMRSYRSVTATATTQGLARSIFRASDQPSRAESLRHTSTWKPFLSQGIIITWNKNWQNRLSLLGTLLERLKESAS